MNNSTEVKQIINLIQGLDADTNFDVFVPSLQANIKFKQLTTEQLKRLLKTVIDSPVYTTEFTLTLNSIIKENCAIQGVNVDDLTIFDKLVIFFATRIESISPDYNFEFTDEERSKYNLKDKNLKYSLEEHFKKFIEAGHIFEPTEININNASVICYLPTIKTENKLEKELHKNIKIDVSTPEELREIIGETFINELTKFITSVTVNESVIDMSSIDFKNRIKIVESLPVNLINRVVKYIENYRSIVKQLMTFPIPGTSLIKDIPYDASFFNM